MSPIRHFLTIACLLGLLVTPSCQWPATGPTRVVLGNGAENGNRGARRVDPFKNIAGEINKALSGEHVIAGSPADFMEVRHLVLKGSNEQIGMTLAQIARERYQAQPASSNDGLRNWAQRRYFEKNYPILHERMRGVAAAFGGRLDDDSKDYSRLEYSPLTARGSVVYYPPGVTAGEIGIVSRNMDLTTGPFRGTLPSPPGLSVTARPYLIELYPDRCFASLAVCSSDLLSGVLDGINSEGLTVALLADGELRGRFVMEPTGGSAVGLGAQQVLRFLLDNCANIDEAKEALLLSKQYYEGIPCHYLIADRHGRAFVWEYSQAHNREYIIEGNGKPLISTNFSLHRHLDGTGPPSAEQAKTICPRYFELARRIEQVQGKLTVSFIKENQESMEAASSVAGRLPNRTLWHALYFPGEGKMQIRFYMRDENAATNKKIPTACSEYLEFTLR